MLLIKDKSKNYTIAIVFFWTYLGKFGTRLFIGMRNYKRLLSPTPGARHLRAALDKELLVGGAQSNDLRLRTNYKVLFNMALWGAWPRPTSFPSHS